MKRDNGIRFVLLIGIAIVVALIIARQADAAPRTAPISFSGTTWTQLGAPLPRTSGAPSSPAVGSDPALTNARESAPATFETDSTVLKGDASWCAPTPTRCQSWGGTAKLGAVPTFRYGDTPYRVSVCNRSGDCVTVRVVSFCGCGERVIDLSPYAFRQLAPLSRGVIPVTVTRVGGGGPAPELTLPPTDVEP